MELVSLGGADLGAAASFIARLQTDPQHHVAYLSVDEHAIRRELKALGDEQLSAGAMLVGEGIRGLLVPEWDVDPPRVWWHGPFSDLQPWKDAADALYAAARQSLPAHVSQEELAGDAAHTQMAAFGAEHGFVRAAASVVLRLEVCPPEAAAAAKGTAGVVVEVVGQAVPPAVARLHDRCFPGTHRVGSQLLADDGIVLLARRGARVLGYARAEVQATGDGYLDFVGVAPESRGQGIASKLVLAAYRLIGARGGRAMHLTVNEGNAAARGLYQAFGLHRGANRCPLPQRLVAAGLTGTAD